MALVAENQTPPTERTRRPETWHFEADTNRVANAEIRGFYANNSRRIAQSFTNSYYLSHQAHNFMLVKSRFDVLMACVAATGDLCTEPPNADAISLARTFLDDLIGVGLFPSKTVPVPRGGVAFYFFANQLTAYAEFLNEGSCCVVSYASDRPTEIQEFAAPDDNNIALKFLRERIGPR